MSLRWGSLTLWFKWNSKYGKAKKCKEGCSSW